MTKLSLVIPCYNEEKTLRSIVERVLGLKSESLDLEVVIVDDCSKDASLEIARALAIEYPCVKAFSHDVNSGKGAALRTGFLAATGDFVGIQDADMEYTPEDYLSMLEPLLAGDADVVYGSRYLKTETRRVLPYWHSRMNQSLTAFSNMFTNLDITDMETCYKLFRREVIREIAPKLRENRFGFEPEVTAHVARGCYRVYERAIDYSPRTFAEGKKIGWKDGVRALYCVFHYGASHAPLPMQLILYFFIGGLSAVINIVAFGALSALTLPFAASILGAFAVSALANYLMCIAILFRHKARWTSSGELAAYLLTFLIMATVDYYSTAFLVAAGTRPLYAKALASVIGFFGNFLLRKYLVFPEKKISCGTGS